MVPQINTLSKQKVIAVVLAGGRDFGRCPMATRLPTDLWPVAGQTALERLLLHLAEQGINRFVIFSGQDKHLLTESIQIDNRLEVEYLDEALPVGTAGSIRQAANDRDDSLFILFPSSLVCPPDIDTLISEHIRSKSDLTVILEPNHTNNCENSEGASGIYICNKSVLEFIPEDGYFDIKEGLIPKMLRAGKNVHAAALSHPVGNFRDCHEYLQAVSSNIKSIAENNNMTPCRVNDSCTLWAGDGVQIDAAANIAGDVILLDGAEVSEGAVVIGPSIIGKNVVIGKNSVVVNSILWDGVSIGENCSIDSCILDYNTNLLPNTNTLERCIVPRQKQLLKNSNNNFLKKIKENQKVLKQIPAAINHGLPDAFRVGVRRTIKYLGLFLVSISFIWSYWSGIKYLWNIWMRSDEYSSGLLVPFLALYILWLRRETILQVPLKPAIFGLFLFIFAQAMRIFGLFFYFSSAENLSIVLSIAALVLFLFGWKLFIKVFTVLLFLFLMLPWPNRIHSAVSLPLQQISTSSAVFCLEVMGFDIIREGNVIHIGNSTVAVAEACNGLRMITAFLVISGLVALLVNRTWWEKLIVLISSLPIAFICNTLRLAITAILFTVIEGPYWEKIFHDFGGYVMMPLALVFIVGQLWLIDKLTVPPEEKEEIIIVRQNK